MNYSLFQLYKLFTYTKTPLPKGVRISEDPLYEIFACVDVKNANGLGVCCV